MEAGTGGRAPEHRGPSHQLAGDAGKRLHTGRSRNDQVATDVRLWLRGEIDLISRCWRLAAGTGGPGRAQHRSDPARVHHLQVASRELRPPHAGYVEMFSRDAERLVEVRGAFNRLPLGAAALAAPAIPLTGSVARSLGMEGSARTRSTR